MPELAGMELEVSDGHLSREISPIARKLAELACKLVKEAYDEEFNDPFYITSKENSTFDAAKEAKIRHIKDVMEEVLADEFFDEIGLSQYYENNSPAQRAADSRADDWI